MLTESGAAACQRMPVVESPMNSSESVCAADERHQMPSTASVILTWVRDELREGRKASY